MFRQEIGTAVDKIAIKIHESLETLRTKKKEQKKDMAYLILPEKHTDTI